MPKPTPATIARRAASATPARTALALSLGAALTLLAGCGTPIPRQDATAEVALPAAYRNAAAATATATAATAATAAAAAATTVETSADAAARRAHGDWWRVFADPTLDRLVDRALANNRDLRIATIQLAQSRLRVDQVQADGKPRLSAPLLAAAQAPGGTVGAVPVENRNRLQPQMSYQASLQGNWTPDLWGERAGMIESTEMQVWRAVHERENLQRNLVGNLVTVYVAWLQANDAIRLARESEATGRGIVTVIEQRLAAGDATADEVEQKRAALYSQQAAMPALEMQREDARNAIALLVGAIPSDLALPEGGIDSLAAPGVATELPSSLLFQRPDIRAVEARMQAARADIAVARARMLPSLNLSAQLGQSSLGVLQLLNPQNLFWNVISGMTASIFDGGRKEADKALSQAGYEEMVETYARTVLQAVREVESALAGVRTARDQLAVQQRLTGSAKNALDLSTTSFNVGALERTTMLESRRNWQRTLEDERRRKADVLKAHVALYQALGGGGLPAGAVGELAALAGSTDAELFAGAAPNGAARGDAPAAGWQVALTGVYHQSTIPAVWRDLNARYAADMAGHALRVRQNGRIESPDEIPQAWHQLSVTRFTGQAEAERFCRLLRSRQQQCAVEAPPGERVASSKP